VAGGRRRALLAAVGLLVAGAALVRGLPARLRLVIGPSGGAPLWVLPVEPGERVTLTYVHSVNGTPVWEEHSVGPDGALFVEEERFVMLGAGMGHWPGHGRLVKRGPHQVIEGIHRRLGHLVLRVGPPSVGHAVLWRGRRLDLSERAAGERILIAVERAGLLAFGQGSAGSAP
jgi:hypothetical protein